MSWDDNPYYSPEKLGLEIVAEVDYSDGDYRFDYRVVWRHTETGKLYTARDAGCSCPSPFEDCKSLEDLEELTSMEALKAEVGEETTRYDSNLSPTEGQDFLNKVRAALR